MSLVSWYKFDEGTSTLGQDSKGSRDMTNTGVTSANSTYGACAYFDGSSYLNLGSASVHSSMKFNNSRTFSCWFNSSGGGAIHSNGPNDSSNQRYRVKFSGTGLISIDLKNTVLGGVTTLATNTWHHYVSTFNSTTDLLTTYVNGVYENSRTVTTLNTQISDFGIGRDPATGGSLFTGFLSDFKLYNGELSASDVSNMYANGPLNAFVPSISATMYTHIADISWNTLSGATNYTVTQTENSGTEETIVSESTELSFTNNDINPGSSYEFKLYSNLDLVTPAVTVTESSPAISNSSVSDLAIRLENDFTQISSSSFNAIDGVLVDVLSTGDDVTLSTGDAIFVENSDTIQVVDGKDVLTPFDSGAGAGQGCTVTTQEGGSGVLTYDEVNNEITKDSTSYSVGDFFILGEYKVKILDTETD